ncbi:MAG: acetate--CoA ligase family protein [bacterium]
MPEDRTAPGGQTPAVPAGAIPPPEFGEGLTELLSPRSVAVIGASTREETLGGKILQNLLAAAFTGPLYPVNPKAESVQGLPAYPSISDVPGEVDLAVIVVPRDFVLSVVEECAGEGIPASIVISAGFGETGEEGEQQEREMLRIAREHGMRLLGPNCMGAINTDPEVGLDATFSPVPALEGGVALVSQSGALGVAILNLAKDLDLGLSQFLSIGNRADVGVVDALAHWSEEERTRVVAMYLESFDEIRAFLETARPLSRRKPLIAVKAGRSEAGARAASSHTGALATSDRTVQALLDQSGVLRAPTVQDLCHWAAAFEKCPLPAGRRVAVVTNAGGPGIMTADACSSSGLEMPPLAGETQEALRSFLPPEAAVRNPVDMIASATAEDYRRAVETVLGDEGVDMVLVLNVTPILYRPVEVVRALAEATLAAEKPCLGVFMAEGTFYQEAASVPGAPPIYRYPEAAVEAMRAMVDHVEWMARPESAFDPFPVDVEAVEDARSRFPSQGGGEEDPGEGPVLLDHEVATVLLEAYGIEVPPQYVVRGAEEAAEAAERIGAEVALKALGGDLLHKSDVGGVALHLRGAGEVLTRAREMQRAVEESGHTLDRFLVQQMVAGGVELIVGARREGEYGTILMAGLGGFFAEALEDVQIRLLPVTPTEVRAMLEGLRGYPLLAGEVRGKGVHLESVVELLGRVSRMAEEVPELAEIELNPVICSHRVGDCRAVDAVLRVDPSMRGWD